MTPSITSKLEGAIFGHRRLVIVLFLVVTAFMAYSASRIGIDAGFAKLLPLKHEYMQTYLEHRQQFGGANRLLIALRVREGDIFTPEFFEALKVATDEVFFIPGVDRAQVSSLWTPNTRFTEVVEDGIAGGNVIPADFRPTPDGLDQVRKNILKAGIVGRLVANDFSGAIISAQLLDVNPSTGEPLDYVEVSAQLEEKIRARFQPDIEVSVESAPVNVHMIGFAKVIGDITAGASRVLLFFAVAFFITAVLVYVYSQSIKLTIIPLACSLIAVTWQLGLLTLLGYGIDPMGILVPFLIFAIGVSHGVQMVSAYGAEVFKGADSSGCGAGGVPATARAGGHRPDQRHDRFRDDSADRDPGHPGDGGHGEPGRGRDHPDEPGPAAGAALLPELRRDLPGTAQAPVAPHGAGVGLAGASG